jgi:DNA topoisomerase-1
MQTFKEIGIPATSIRKYHAAGISSAEEFCTLHPVLLAERSGISLDTVYRHADLVCGYLKRPAPKKMTKRQLEKSRKDLMAIRGMTDAMILPLLQAGIADTSSLLAASVPALSASTGIPSQTISGLQASAKKIKDNEIIRI